MLLASIQQHSNMSKLVQKEMHFLRVFGCLSWFRLRFKFAIHFDSFRMRIYDQYFLFRINFLSYFAFMHLLALSYFQYTCLGTQLWQVDLTQRQFQELISSTHRFTVLYYYWMNFRLIVYEQFEISSLDFFSLVKRSILRGHRLRDEKWLKCSIAFLCVKWKSYIYMQNVVFRLAGEAYYHTGMTHFISVWYDSLRQCFSPIRIAAETIHFARFTMAQHWKLIGFYLFDGLKHLRWC